jgi:cobalt-precorrin 5A hydrolase
LVLFLATGAAVRLIAPHLSDKRTDPAVVAVDDAGRFAVSLLSGHRGGANDLARRVAGILGAQAVVTTASDAHGLPAADLIGQEFGWRIEREDQLARLAAVLVNGDPVGVYQDAGERDWHGSALLPHATRCASLDALLAAPLDGAIVITDRAVDVDALPSGWVVYRPRTLALGIGCSRGASAAEIEALVHRTLDEAGLSPLCLRVAASLDLKADEPGLLEFVATKGLELRLFTAEQLDAAPGQLTPSQAVRAAVGARGVCEPAALLTAGAETLLVPKRKSERVTVALARFRTEG